MKLVSWIDEAAPGFAHGFVKCLFVIGFLHFLLHWNNSSRTGQLIENPFWTGTACLWVLLWTLCFQMWRSPVARFCLGSSSGILFLCLAVVMAGSLSYSTHHSSYGLGVIFVIFLMGIPLVGFGSMLWISLRPPQNLKYFRLGPIL
jgi:hypothetical protein